MLGQGTGSEIRQPLAYAMVGGLIVSQAPSLFTTPVVYLYLDQLSVWLTGRGRSGTPSVVPTAQPAESTAPGGS
jgi:hydrophobic/amphiphilic exporter-1 (mainly G- bacteria), HAE1 family